MKRIDVVSGDRFGKWVVLFEVPKVNGRRKLRCECQCRYGTTIDVDLHNMLNGKSSSCIKCSRRKNKTPAPIGKIFGQWKVIKEVDTPKHLNNRFRYVLAICVCNKKKIVSLDSIKRGLSTSCGCVNIEASRLMGQSNKIHGLYNHPLYQVYQDMMRRCYDVNCERYSDYGGRGIIVCKAWHKIQNFINWAESLPNNKRWRKGLTLDRINNNYSYNPANCRFTTPRVQSNNRRSNRYYEYFGEILTLREIATKAKVSYEKLRGSKIRNRDIYEAVDKIKGNRS